MTEETLPIFVDNAKMIGKHRLLEKLGEGAMGVVFRAEDSVLQRNVAIKFLKFDGFMGNEEQARHLKQRFIQEASACARLKSPHIVTVHEFGVDRDQLYIVMEEVRGQSLSQRIKGRKIFSEAEALKILIQLCRGIACAHDAGIVHRDIKPSNIMLGDDGHVTIMDFGIAHCESNHLTRTGMMLGTPNYMSPEQVHGVSIDQRSDIFSIGACAYEMLTGEKSFPGNSITAISYKIVHDTPIPISRLNNAIGGFWQDFIDRCLAKNREQRFPNCHAMVEWLSGQIEASRSVGNASSIGPRFDVVPPKNSVVSKPIDNGYETALAAAREDVANNNLAEGNVQFVCAIFSLSFSYIIIAYFLFKQFIRGVDLNSIALSDEKIRESYIVATKISDIRSRAALIASLIFYYGGIAVVAFAGPWALWFTHFATNKEPAMIVNNGAHWEKIVVQRFDTAINLALLMVMVGIAVGLWWLSIWSSRLQVLSGFLAGQTTICRRKNKSLNLRQVIEIVFIISAAAIVLKISSIFVVERVWIADPLGVTVFFGGLILALANLMLLSGFMKSMIQRTLFERQPPMRQKVLMGLLRVLTGFLLLTLPIIVNYNIYGPFVQFIRKGG